MLASTLAVGCSDDTSEESGSSAGTGGSTSAATASGPTSGTDSTDSTTGGATQTSTADTTAGTDDPTSGTAASDSSGDTTGDSDSTTGGSDSSGSDGSTSGTESESSSGGTMIIDDPFDPESCSGTPLTLEEADALLAGMDRQVVTNATIQVRERTCPGGACGEWGEAYDWVITYLTWSGGVTTAYKDFQADMQLVVFDDQGTTRLSLQHVTFDDPASTYDDEDGMVYDLTPQTINYPHVRAYDSNPDSQYYYQELDWQVRDGVLTLGEDCVRWVADPYIQQPPFTEQYALVFHW